MGVLQWRGGPAERKALPVPVADAPWGSKAHHLASSMNSSRDSRPVDDRQSGWGRCAFV